jgi:hypothetical protein
MQQCYTWQLQVLMNPWTCYSHSVGKQVGKYLEAAGLQQNINSSEQNDKNEFTWILVF